MQAEQSGQREMKLKEDFLWFLTTSAFSPTILVCTFPCCWKTFLSCVLQSAFFFSLSLSLRDNATKKKRIQAFGCLQEIISLTSFSYVYFCSRISVEGLNFNSFIFFSVATMLWRFTEYLSASFIQTIINFPIMHFYFSTPSAIWSLLCLMGERQYWGDDDHDSMLSSVVIIHIASFSLSSQSPAQHLTLSSFALCFHLVFLQRDRIGLS